jgi:hypothetical protein
MRTALSVSPTRTAAGPLPYLVATLSALYAVLGAYWTFGGRGYPFGPVPPHGDRLDILSLVPRDFGAAVVAVMGALGLPAALATRWSGWSAAAYRPLLATATVQAVVFGLLCTDMTILIVTGYALVLIGIPAFLLMLILGALRSSATRLLLAAVAGLIAVLMFGLGVINGLAFRDLADGLAGAPRNLGIRPVLVLGAFLLGGGWAVLGIRTFRTARGRCVRCGRPGARWTRPEAARRWGFGAIIVAALCPMPYALVRLTWLLPNPIGTSADQLDAEPATLMFGLALGAVAFCAGLVTLGLIRPWGEIWPRWVPVLAGRRVPIRAAVIPGTIAGLLLFIGSPSLFSLLPRANDLLIVVLLPFPLWGTSVGLATAAYYFRRRTQCTSCGRI